MEPSMGDTSLMEKAVVFKTIDSPDWWVTTLKICRPIIEEQMAEGDDRAE